MIDFDRMFECTKAIKFNDVKNAIDSFIYDDGFLTNCSGNIVRKNLKRELFDFNWSDDDYIFNFNNSNNVMAYEIYMDRHYEYESCKVNKNDVVVDIGANIGIFSRYACELGASKVISYEPDPVNFKCLIENSKEYNITPINKAVSDINGQIDFNVKKGSGIGTISGLDTIQFPNEFEKIVTVDCDTFDDVCKNNGLDKIDFLKIDVEGAEKNIIYSMTQRDFDIVDKIVLEYHHSAFNFDDPAREDFIKYIVSMGYSNFYILHLRGDNCNMMYFWK